MARYKGTFTTAANYEPLIAAPFDARQLVECKADLTKPSTWQRSDGNAWTYAGMMVAVAQDVNAANNGIYMLTAEDYTVAENWMKLSDSRDLQALREEIANIETSGSLDVEVSTEDSLPEIGDENTTYYVKENSSIQRWDEETGSYKSYGGTGEIPELNINIIYGGDSNGNTTD